MGMLSAGRSGRSSLFRGALLLTVGSMAMRGVQVLFQVYISGIMGAGGLGRMQLILTVGSFAAILGSGGIRIAVTCLAAEEAGRDSPGGIRAAMRCSVLYGLFLSVPVGIGLFLLSSPLAGLFVSDESAAGSLKILALFLPVGCLGAIFSGYYTAAGRITELVGVELVERILSIGLVVGLLKIQLFPDPCMAVLLGASVCSVGCLLYLVLRCWGSLTAAPAVPMGPMLRRMLKLTLPVGCNDILRSGLSSLENMMVPRGLRQGGISQESAMAAYGTVCGMVFPVLTFPSVILYSLSDLLVPELARSRAKGRTQRIAFLTDKCLKLTMLYAVGAAGLLVLLGPELGQLLFHSAEAGSSLRIYGPLVILLYVDAITDGMLKGLSQQLHTVRFNTLTSLLDLGLLVLLLPRWGMGGFLRAFTISHGVNFWLSLGRLFHVTGYRPKFHATVSAALSCGVSIAVVRLLSRSPTPASLLLHGGVFLSCYAALILFTGALSRDDLCWLRQLIRREL